MAQLALSTVYQTYASVTQDTGKDSQPGSLEVTGGEVNIYFSNAEAEPANAAAMTVDPNGPYTGIVEVVAGARWVLVELATGAPVVNDFRVAKV